MKKCNDKSSDFCHFHHQTLFINTILNVNKLTNSLESVLKTKSAKVKLVKSATDTVSNIIDIFVLLK